MMKRHKSPSGPIHQSAANMFEQSNTLVASTKHPTATQTIINKCIGQSSSFSDECCVLDPTTRCSLAWDVVIVLVILWNVSLGFYEASFVNRHNTRICAKKCLQYDDSVPEGYCMSCPYVTEQAIFTWISYLGDALFMVEVVVNFRTAIVVKVRGQKVFIKDMGTVSMKYLRGFFIVDLLGIGVPFGLLDLLRQDDSVSSDQYEQLFLLAYVTSILKILRLFRLNALLKRLYLGTVDFQKYLMLIKLCFVLMLAAHLIGCLFWGLFTFSDGTPTAPDGWIVSSGLHNAKDPFDQYISTVYFALMTLTSIGYGDITPSTTSEMVFVVCVTVVGAILYALLLALLTSLLSKFVSSSQPLTDAMEALDVFLDITNASPSLKREVMDTLQYQWRLSSTFDIGLTVRELPSALRHNVLETLHRPMLVKTPFLAHTDAAFVGELAQNLRMQVCLPGAHIYSTGNLATDMYFINEGTVLLMAYNQPQVQFKVKDFISSNTHHGDPTMPTAAGESSKAPKRQNSKENNSFICLEKLGAGGYFGENGILLQHSRRAFVACGSTHCELLSVRYSDIFELLNNFRNVTLGLRRTALKRSRRFVNLLTKKIVIHDMLLQTVVGPPHSWTILLHFLEACQLTLAGKRRNDKYLRLERNGEKVFETSTRIHTNRPFWNEVYVEKTVDHCLPKFTVKVFDRDALQESCIGQGHIRGYDIIRSLQRSGGSGGGGIPVKIPLYPPFSRRHSTNESSTVREGQESNSSSSRRQAKVQPEQHFGKRLGTAQVSPGINNRVKSASGAPSATGEGDKAESQDQKQASDLFRFCFGQQHSLLLAESNSVCSSSAHTARSVERYVVKCPFVY
eukprot:INCI7688.2.p1 GENE.INCI7688.2~~INCI7688.2.p1  ORF type:complete len:849 (-),score=84.98 INCI7688.2:1220-3766(-)